jgi:hypothetical protein
MAVSRSVNLTYQRELEMALSLHIDFLSEGVPSWHGDHANRDRQRLLG